MYQSINHYESIKIEKKGNEVMQNILFRFDDRKPGSGSGSGSEATSVWRVSRPPAPRLWPADSTAGSGLPVKKSRLRQNKKKHGRLTKKLRNLHRTACSKASNYSQGCGVAQLVVRRLAVSQARVRFSARRPFSCWAKKRWGYKKTDLGKWWKMNEIVLCEWLLKIININKSGIMSPNL